MQSIFVKEISRLAYTKSEDNCSSWIANTSRFYRKTSSFQLNYLFLLLFAVRCQCRHLCTDTTVIWSLYSCFLDIRRHRRRVLNRIILNELF